MPSGEGVILEPKNDARYVAALPLDEVGEDLKRLIESVQNGDDDEDDE